MKSESACQAVPTFIAGLAPGMDDADADAREIEYRKSELFFRTAIGAQAAFIAVGGLLVYQLGGAMPPAWSLAWWGVASLVALARMGLAMRFFSARVAVAEAGVWRRRAEAGAALAGVVWSLGGIAMMTAGQDSTRLFFALMMAGMAASAVATLSALPRAFKAFAVPVSLSIILTALIDRHGPDDYLLAASLTVLLLVLLRSAGNLHDSLDRSIRDALRMRRMAREVEEATAALRVSEARLSMLMEHDPSAIFLIDRGGGVHYCNPAAERLLGCSLEVLRHIRPADLLSDTPAEGSQNLGPREQWLTRADGSRVMVEARDVPLPDGNLLRVMIDITEHKRIEAELEQHRHHLEEMVEKRTMALMQATSQAERLARVKGEFLANMSHELRTPLNGVLGFAEVGLGAEGVPTRARGYFRHIHNSGQVLLKVINDILDFSKIDAGELKTESITYSIRELVAAVLVAPGETARRKGVDVRIEWGQGLPERALGDPYRLRQVLGNLLDNAVKFTDSGGILVSVRLDRGMLHYAVSDTGIGMTPDELGDIFSPFHQADSSTTRRYGGTGLGLAICKRLVELMRGEIRVESAPGIGSLFEVSLPYRPAIAAAPESVDDGAGQGISMLGQRLAGLRLLVAEDNEVNRMLLEEMLAAEGCQPDLAVNGAEAIDRVRERGAGAYDIVLMDVQMPVLNGHDATRRILALDPSLPILGQTAHALEAERAQCLEAGMVEHLAKSPSTSSRWFP
jgi:PAS domain S-box-containing protein